MNDSMSDPPSRFLHNQPSVALASAPVDDRRWPAWYALVTACLFPATTTRRMGHVSLLSAWLVHAVALVLTFFVYFGFLSAMTLAYDRDRSLSFAALWGEFHDTSVRALEHLRSQPVEVLFGVGVNFLAIEVVCAVLAFAALPFGAGVERFRDSIRHALRRVWLHTGHIGVACLLAGLVTVGCAVLQAQWDRKVDAKFEASHPRPVQPADDAGEAALEEYRRATSEWLDARYRFAAAVRDWGFVDDHVLPWYVKYRSVISMYAWYGAGAWFLWAVFRGVSAPRLESRLSLDPLCRFCGYNLTALSLDTRCPECGRNVADSLAVTATPGAPWERRAGARWRAYRATAFAALRRPAAFGRTLNLLVPKVHCLRFLVLHLVVSAFIAGVGATIHEYASTPLSLFALTCWWVGPAYGFLVVVVYLPMVAVAVVVAGLNICARDGRNVMAGVVQLACYGSGYLVVWTFLSVLLAISSNLLWDVVIQLEAMTGINRYALSPLIWLAANVLAAIGYVVLVHRGSAGVRYASR